MISSIETLVASRLEESIIYNFEAIFAQNRWTGRKQDQTRFLNLPASCRAAVCVFDSLFKRQKRKVFSCIHATFLRIILTHGIRPVPSVYCDFIRQFRKGDFIAVKLFEIAGQLNQFGRNGY